MKIPPTQRLANEFDERNVVLQLMLGGLALGRRLDNFIDRWTTSKPRQSQTTPARHDEAATVEFLLGVIAFRQHFERLVAEACVEVSAPTVAGTGTDPVEVLPRELLR